MQFTVDKCDFFLLSTKRLSQDFNLSFTEKNNNKISIQTNQHINNAMQNSIINVREEIVSVLLMLQQLNEKLFSNGKKLQQTQV